MDELVTELRSAGCVFAEDEAQILRSRAADGEQLARWVRRRVAGEPLEHIVGIVEFAGLDLVVGPGVFIPRQRSRLLAAVASGEVRATPDSKTPVFIEPYCGVAPLAAVVARDHPHAAVVVSDVDPVALDYARRNVGPRARVCEGAGLSGLPSELRGGVAVIAAVPPYVPDDELDLMPGEARDHEPVATHAGGAAGLAEVRRLIVDAAEWLAPGGVLAVEMHRDQTDEAAGLATRSGSTATVVTEHPAYADDGHTAVLVMRGRSD